MDEVECVVIGAGIIGLAVARALAQSGRDVVVVEKEDAIGTHTSSRNSEVIHAGIYYPHDSLMARFCVAGRKALYAYCEQRSIPHDRCQKLIVATDDREAEMLSDIQRRAAANGVGDLAFLERGQALDLEPALSCSAALLSPSTGIVDSHALMLAYRGDAEDAGAMIAFECPFVRGEVVDGGFLMQFGGNAPIKIKARMVVNSAGLFAPDVASRIAGLPGDYIPKAYYARGTYFTLAGHSPFSRLIYPVPVPGGLGTHLTLDLGGNARFGPDVEWVDNIDYTVDASRRTQFADAIRRYWPGIDESRLHPGYAGLRPKIVPKGAPAQDFVIQGAGVHGVDGLVNLFGIESPGLTASLAIADHVLELLEPAEPALTASTIG